MLAELTIDCIREAAERIRGRVVHTPVLTLELEGRATLYCKAESLQPTGAFKLRGAFNLMQMLPQDVAGVVAHSSGNHAQAVARAARMLGIPCVVVMPNDAPALKRARTEAEGAEVVVVGPDSQERANRAAEIAAERGLVEVPPYDHLLIAAGQGTSALELVEETGPLDQFYAPVSGGGLMAGCAVAVHELSPDCEIVGCEPDDADDTKRSLAAGKRVSVPPPKTLADGLRVRIPGELTWPVLRKHVKRIELVSDDAMLDAMAFALGRMRLVLEPSGACSLAVALREARGRCGVLLSGGNVDPGVLAQVARRAPDAGI